MEYFIPPWEHQKLAIERAKDVDYFGLFFQMGTGKSATLVNILRQKYKDAGKHLRTLILCPPIVIENWKREFLAHSHIPERQIVTLTGSLYSRLHATDEPKDKTYITNYEGLWMTKLFERFQKMNFEVIVLDESHRIKTHNSKTTKAVLKLAEKAQFRYCLSGTPILNTIADIFPQILFLDKGETFGENFFTFRQKYFTDFNACMPKQKYFPNWKMIPNAPKMIQKAIEPISMRVIKSECLDLPPLVRQRVDCALTDEQANIYRNLEKEFYAELSSGHAMVDLELTKGLRLQQLVSGFIPNDKKEIIKFKEQTRLQVLRDLLEQLCKTHKVLVWACFRENFKDISATCLSLKLPFVEVHGGISALTKQESIEAFQCDPNIRVFIGHPRSGGIGCNLTEASYSIFYSRSFSLEDELQAEARNYRGGSERHTKVTRIDFVTPGTIDEIVMHALASKQQLGEAILKHYKQKETDACYQQQHTLPNPHSITEAPGAMKARPLKT